MNTFVDLLPAAWQTRAKAIFSLLGVVLAGLVMVAPALPSWLSPWAGLIIAALTTLLVHQVPAPGYVAPARKVSS
jgi:hypothetical protein